MHCNVHHEAQMKIMSIIWSFHVSNFTPAAVPDKDIFDRSSEIADIDARLSRLQQFMQANLAMTWPQHCSLQSFIPWLISHAQMWKAWFLVVHFLAFYSQCLAEKLVMHLGWKLPLKKMLVNKIRPDVKLRSKTPKQECRMVRSQEHWHAYIVNPCLMWVRKVYTVKYTGKLACALFWYIKFKKSTAKPEPI